MRGENTEGTTIHEKENQFHGQKIMKKNTQIQILQRINSRKDVRGTFVFLTKIYVILSLFSVHLCAQRIF